MNEINKKRNFLILFFTFIFLLINTSTGVATSGENITYASSSTLISFRSGGFSSHTSRASSFHRTKSAGGSFKSGSFSSSKSQYKSNYSNSTSSSGSFKSGSFSNSKTSTSKSEPNHNYGTSTTTSHSFFPIPIPIPWGHHYSIGNNYIGSSLSFTFLWWFIKFIVCVIFIIFIINKITKFRRF
jgi:hypothetical protein